MQNSGGADDDNIGKLSTWKLTTIARHTAHGCQEARKQHGLGLGVIVKFRTLNITPP